MAKAKLTDKQSLGAKAAEHETGTALLAGGATSETEQADTRQQIGDVGIKAADDEMQKEKTREVEQQGVVYKKRTGKR